MRFGRPRATGVSPMWSSAIAVRNIWLSGDTHRRISSTAPMDQRWILRELLPLVLVIAEHPQATADRGAGGLGAAGDEQTRLVHDRVIVHRAAAYRSVGPHRDERIVRLFPEPRHCLVEIRLELGDRGHDALQHLSTGVARDRVEAHHPLRPRLEVAPAVLWEPEQVGRVPARKLRGDARPRLPSRRHQRPRRAARR